MDANEIMQSQNFEYLRPHWPELASLCGFAEQYVQADPESAMVKLRAFAERSVTIVYGEVGLPRAPMSNFMELLSNHAFEGVTPKVIIDKLHAIRIHGNKAAHGDKVSLNSALWLLREAWDLGRWLYATYANGDTKTLPEFQQPSPPQSPKNQYKKERKALLEQYAKQEAQMQALLAELEKEREKRALLEKTAEELTAVQQKAQSVAKALHFDEQTTRHRLIDTQLAGRGWDLGANGANTEQVTQEEKILHQPTKSGEGYADYVLWDDNGRPLAVVEAKKTSVDAETGRHQARHYANGLEKMHGQRPVIFYTNGYDIWMWDDHPAQNYPPRKLYDFYSKSSLQFLIRKRAERKPFATVSPKQEILTDRLYQHEALKRICECYEEKQRKALAVQATGTGKTRLAIALSDVCMQAGWAKRVLFLCDRRELRKQAKNAYSEFLNAPITVLNSKSVDDTANQVFVATYPAMIKIFARFDPGFFDLLIADESHRSIYNIYGDLFRYFDALQLGLTATPVEMVSRSTCQLFGCDFKQPTTNYDLDRAIEEGYLVPYEVVKHTTKFLRDGIKGHALTPEQVAELEDKGIDPNALDFEAGEIDRAIYNKDTNRKILQNLMENGIRQADGQTLGKTIIFARNHRHAKLLEELFDELFPQYAGKFCQVIDNYDPRADELIDDFKGQGSNDQLTIAVSVDMLDTGIDVPEIVNLVFARPVKSPIKFWQMVGRGTRLCKDLLGKGKDKTHFQIFDHWGVVEYHGLKQRDVTVSQSKPMMQRLFETRLQLAKEAINAAEVDFFDTLAQWLHKTINSLDENALAVRDKWKIKKQMSELETIRQFAPNAVILLETEIAPLMQWLDIRGHADAYQWDLLITRIEQEKLKGSGRFDDLVGDAIAQLHQLQMNLNQVKAKADIIKQCREPDWWQAASLEEMDEARTQLRGILKYRDKGGPTGHEPPVIDIQDGNEISEPQSTYLTSVDMRAYRVKVEQALQELFDSDPVLQKIRQGKTVTEQELKNLNALIHIQHPDIDLNTLKGFYGTAAPMEQILRTIVGLDDEAVNARFADFVQIYPNLSARQVQFLGMLKRQIGKSGAIELDSLYEMPFSTLGDPDTVFDNNEQIDRLLEIVENFGHHPQSSTGSEDGATN
ncbi:MAG: DEAD/DEAH box helicase family protein [gamma proteobacterium endosymbiont of Lamellibrachia anaximandri]|nr:DEAD/DEAH box helicase family protein [gamma proteobacterium endosymbiont of Lamellibrachia anaximandri]MBL3535632.1 DEAD/DEAH box helicase family protein [gamma proteobacterium endosymbiont of Lamellibrachia anaximandri]